MLPLGPLGGSGEEIGHEGQLRRVCLAVVVGHGRRGDPGRLLGRAGRSLRGPALVHQPAEHHEPGGFIEIGDKLYGVSREGGASDLGTVFEVDPAAGRHRVLYSFSGRDDGGLPSGRLAWVPNDPAGPALYGTTLYYGTGGAGTVFRLTLDGTLTSCTRLRPTRSREAIRPGGLVLRPATGGSTERRATAAPTRARSTESHRGGRWTWSTRSTAEPTGPIPTASWRWMSPGRSTASPPTRATGATARSTASASTARAGLRDALHPHGRSCGRSGVLRPVALSVAGDELLVTTSDSKRLPGRHGLRVQHRDPRGAAAARVQPRRRRQTDGGARRRCRRHLRRCDLEQPDPWQSTSSTGSA